jgi:sigma-E factor negative regulatory protein RseC
MSAAHDRVQVSDPIGVKVGDAVVVGIAEGALIRASLLAYLLPLLFLIVAAYGVRTAGGAEGVSALVGILALCFGIWMAPGLAHRLSGQDEYRPRLLERSHPLTAAVSLPAPGLPGGDSTY